MDGGETMGQENDGVSIKNDDVLIKNELKK